MPDGDLYIRATSGDTGARPLPPNTVYWESPSVGLFETGSNVPLDAATAGTQYDIRVRVANKSTNAFNATVQVYAAKWGAVNPFLQSVGGRRRRADRAASWCPVARPAQRRSSS